jgi:hypothetical protein
MGPTGPLVDLRGVVYMANHASLLTLSFRHKTNVQVQYHQGRIHGTLWTDRTIVIMAMANALPPDLAACIECYPIESIVYSYIDHMMIMGTVKMTGIVFSFQAPTHPAPPTMLPMKRRRETPASSANAANAYESSLVPKK